MGLEIILENIRVSRGGRPILDNVSWHLPPGGRVALVGGNGAGKSTLMRLARGEIWPDQLPGGAFAGQRIYKLEGQSSASPIEARERIGLAGVDLRDLYRRRGWNVSGWLVVVSGLTDSPLPSGTVGEAERSKALAALDNLGLSELAYKPLREMSQGQVMAALLARAMVRSPLWLFLDEATDGLDGASRKMLRRVLEKLAGQGVGLAAATHHPSSLPDLGFTATVLKNGRVVKSGLLSDMAKHLAPSRLERRSKQPPVQAGPPLIEVRKATLTLSGNDILKELDWSLSPGQHWVVAGRNGAGKSSFIKLLAGEEHPAAGAVNRFGLPELTSLWDLRACIGLVSWEQQAEYPAGTTVREVLVSGFFGSFGLYDEPGSEMLATAASWMDRLGLTPLADRLVNTLSQGQARKAMIGRALVFDPQVLLLDEPLGGLDPSARADVLTLLDDLAAQGKSLVMVTHNPHEIPASITHGLVLENGRAVAVGPVDQALAAYNP